MTTFPRFLESSPQFLGLKIADLIFLVLLTYIGALIDLNPLIVFFASFSLLIALKLLNSKFDLGSFLYASRTKTVSWKRHIHKRIK